MPAMVDVAGADDMIALGVTSADGEDAAGVAVGWGAERRLGMQAVIVNKIMPIMRKIFI